MTTNAIVEEQVLRRIVPQKSILPIVDAFVSKIKRAAAKLELQCRVVIGGSVAKDTHLAGDFDCDIFIRFDPKKYADEKLGLELTRIVEALNLDAELLHGSRDYYKVTVDTITYELVPTLDVSDANLAPNVTDMSLFHVDWTVGACKKKPGLNNQIRLLKAFCKAQQVYGAESYIGGFSGHVVDILVVHYGSFENVLMASANWKVKDIIDPQHHYDGKNPLSLLNEAKTQSALIIIDPIVSQRNAASALGIPCFEKFKAAAKAYLAAPSITFFEKKEFDETNLDSLPGSTYHISIIPRSDKKDIAGAQHVKILEYVLEQAKKLEFEIVGSGWRWGSDNYSGDLYLRVASDELSAKTIVAGPPVSMEKAVAIFKSVHQSTFQKDGRLWASAQRKYSHFGSLLDAIPSHELVSMRVKSFSWKKL